MKTSQGPVVAWQPRVDGVFLTEPPQHSVLRGHVSNVPVITGVFAMSCLRTEFICTQGNCEDDGSVFGIPTLNISYVDNYFRWSTVCFMSSSSTTADVKDYVKLVMMPRANDKEIDDLLVHYPDDIRAGCPFDTGFKNALGICLFWRLAEVEPHVD